MLKLKSILTVAVLSLVCGFVMAQPQGPDEGPGGPGGPGGRHEMRREKPGGDFFKAINATEEQIEKLKPVMKAQMERMKQSREENREKFQAARKAMQEARKSKNEDAIAKAKEQMKALAAEGKKLHEQFLKDLSTVLSDEQMEKAKDFFQKKVRNRMHKMRGGNERGRGDMFKDLGLTDEQKSKIKDIMADARKKAQDADEPKEKREIMEAAKKKIDEVLTDEQKTKLEKMKPQRGKRPGQKQGENHRGMMMNPLEGIATPEQMEQAKKIMEDAHKQAAEIMKSARKKINDEVLNEEQRKALQERMEQFKKRMKAMQGRRDGRPGGEGKDSFNRRPGGPGECAESCKSDGPKRKEMRDRKMRRPRQDALMSILTEDQKAQAKKILDEAREKAKAAEDPKEKREIMKAARQKIKKEILTDEQRKQLEEKRKNNKEKCTDSDKKAAETGFVPAEEADLIAMICDEQDVQEEEFLPEGPEFGPVSFDHEGLEFAPEGPEFGPMELEPEEFDRPAPPFDDMES